MEPFDVTFNKMTLSDPREAENKVVADAEKLALHGPPFTTRSPTKSGYTAWVVFNGRTNGVFETWYVISLKEASDFNCITGLRLLRKLGASPMLVRGVLRLGMTLKPLGTMPLPMVLWGLLRVVPPSL